MGAPYIYDISRLRVRDLHSATYIYVVRRLRVKENAMSKVLSSKTRWNCVQTDFCFAVALRPNAGRDLLILEISRSHTTTQHSR